MLKDLMIKNHLRLITAGMLSTALLGVATPAIALDTVKPVKTGIEKEERYIVKYTASSDTDKKSKELKDKGASVDKTFKNTIKGAAIKATPAEAANIAKTPGVASVEVDLPVSVSDTQTNAPWGLDRMDQQALPLSGTFTAEANAGKGVDVYIVDSGIRADHSEFTGRIASGWSRITDGTGVTDCNGHGTHVAGTAAGAKYGVAKSATIIPVRVFGCSGSGYTSDVIAGLDWVASHHQAGKPAVVNLSLGGTASASLDTAMNAIINEGVTATVAAGNSATDACTASPARVPAAITVASSDRTDGQSSFSSFGSCVDMYAPGSSVLSAWYTGTTATATSSGTSMAAPHVAGAAAVLLSRNPALTPAQVSTELNNTATTGVIKNATAGTPNRLLFLNQTTTTTTPAPVTQPTAPAPKAPNAPTSVTATAKTGGASLSWTKGSDNGTVLTKQTIHVYEGTTKIQSLDLGGEYTSANLNGFPGGKTYTYTLTATNSAGTSPESAKSNAITTPVTVKAPSAPTAVKATAATGAAIVSWTKGNDGGSPLTSQVITVYSGTTVVKTVTVPASTTSSSIAGLYNGTYYTFSVKAVNSIGISPESAKSAAITPIAKAPSSAVSVKATANDNSANVSWTRGSENGAPLTSQVITVYSGITKIGTVTIGGQYNSVKVTGLTQGRNYTFTVKEVNKMGTSPETAKSNIVTPY